MKQGKTGYITVYLSLTLGILMSFVFLMLEAVRIQTIRTQTESVMDIGLFSLFGEYHRELLEQYDLLYIDTAYGEGTPDIKRSQEHLQYYLNENLEPEFNAGFFQIRDLTDLHCDNVSFDAYEYASDEEGKGLKGQILEYMKEKQGIKVIESGIEKLLNLQKNGSLSRDVEGEWERANETVQNIVEERKKELMDLQSDEMQEVGIDNPSEHVRQMSKEGILGLAMPPKAEISVSEISLENYLSHRNLRKGTGTLVKENSFADKVTEDVLLQEYLFEKCGYYNHTLNKSLLKYQIEYLLKGGKKDLKNLEAVLKDILHIREVINISYLFSDAEKINEANNLAWLISLILLTPELQEAVKISVMFAWSYAESVKDIRILLDGNNVPAVKNKANWNTPLSQLLTFKSHLGTYKTTEEGMNYKDYLSFFLYLKPEKQVLYRFMDICEMDIRKTDGNSYFCMDGCVEAVKATANVSSGYGYGFQITRSYSYR